MVKKRDYVAEAEAAGEKDLVIEALKLERNMLKIAQRYQKLNDDLNRTIMKKLAHQLNKMMKGRPQGSKGALRTAIAETIAALASVGISNPDNRQIFIALTDEDSPFVAVGHGLADVDVNSCPMVMEYYDSKGVSTLVKAKTFQNACADVRKSLEGQG